MGDWRSQVGDRLISAESAADMITSGQTVVFTMGREAYSIGIAIAARMGDLTDVHIVANTPGYDFGWYDEGWQDAFEVIIQMPTGTCQEAVDARRCDVHPSAIFNSTRPLVWFRQPNLLVTELSPPDERGFCSFGQSLWNKKRQIQEARKLGIPVVAEINENLIRTHGDNFIHLSAIDYFVEHTSSGAEMGTGTLAGREKKAPEPYLKDIAANVSELIRDGDTIQIGVGRTTEPLVGLGVFAGKRDLGYHSEATPAGVLTLAREGVINGRRKTLHPGKLIVTSLGGGTKEEMRWAQDNPMCELADVDYVADIRIISANDNMVALNNALAIDLGGQMTAESLGGRVISASGGQAPFVIGALHSKGGRSIHVLPSTAQGGKVSRIVPELLSGTLVTVPRNCMDYVITEWGIARLWGKSQRQRAEELIAIAHPDFRSELRDAARQKFYP